MTEGQAGAVSKGIHPVAQRAEVAGAVPDSVTSIRMFKGHVHRLAVLGLVEFVVVLLSVHAAVLTRFPGESLAATDASPGSVWSLALLAACVMMVGLASMGLYELRQRALYSGVLARLLIAVLALEAVLWIGAYLVPSIFVGRGALAMIGVLSFSGLALVRYAYLRIVDRDVFKRRILVWGAGARAATIAVRMRRRTDQRGFRIMGYVRSPGDEVRVPHADLIASDGDLLRFAVRHQVEEIIVAMDDRRQGFPENFLRECRLRGIAVQDIVSFLERESGRVCIELAQPSWLIYSEGFRSNVLRLAVKRAFDLCVAAILIAATAPIMLLAAIAIFLEDRGPILYSQVRAGKNGRQFRMLKFRSMSVNAEPGAKAIWAARNDPRVTRVGSFIRRYRIDELPQAFNVLLGDMSVVGPRPERPTFVESLSRSIQYYSERHYVKPGITGWAQVRYPYGASESDAREKLGYDLYYVVNHNLAFDLMVLLQTVEIVLLRIGSR